MLPALSGDPIRVEVRRSLGVHLAATSIPGRLIRLDRSVFSRAGEFERILVHEVFHFAWVRLGNPLRREWERVLETELELHAAGELGWSAEWRKKKLERPRHKEAHTRVATVHLRKLLRLGGVDVRGAEPPR